MFSTARNSHLSQNAPRSRRRLLGVLVAALGAAAGAHADEPLQLEEMVVTAQKREQSLQDVPLAVTALGATAIEDAGIRDMKDISRQVPALEVQSSVSPVMTNFRIRRVGNLGNIPTFEPAVGVFQDGAFRSRAIFGASELFDIERIEILRGPQSTLYGKNTTAGVIGIYTAAPKDHFEWKNEASVGNVSGAGGALSAHAKTGVTGPLTEALRGSLSGSWNSQGETMDEDLAHGGDKANDAERYSVRGQLAWDASDALSFRLIAGTVQEDDKQETADIRFDPNGPLANVVLPLWQRFGISDTCASNDPHDRDTCVAEPLTTELSAWETTLLADYAFENGMTLHSISSFDSFMFRGTMDDVAQMMAPLLKFHDSQDSESWQQELRLNSAGGETVDWLAGVFLYSNDFARGDGGDRATWLGDTYSAHPVVAAVNQQLFRTPIPLPMAAPGQLGYLDSTLDTEYLGVYGQGTWNISEAFALTAGLRWQQEDKDADIRQWVDVPAPSVMSVALAPAAVSADGLQRDTDEVTWSVTPQWTVSDSLMLFATASHGFKSGGFNTGFGRLPIASREFADEDILHYEAGSKLELLDGRMRLAASAFLTTYDDYQDAAFVGGQFTVGNAEEAELKGFEFEGSARLTERLSTDFAVSYADFSYEKNTTAQCYPGRAPDSTTMPGACDLSGEHPVNAPEWKTHAGLQYEQPVSWGDVYARADWSWTDEYNTSFSADPRLVQDAYSWVNLRAGTRWDDYSVELWVENATDETVVNFDAVVTLYAAPTDGSYQSLLQAPRSWGLSFRADF